MQEEEEDRFRYGRLTRKHQAHGKTHIGPYAGHYAWENRKCRLKEGVSEVDPSRNKGFKFAGSMKLSGGGSRPVFLTRERKWYEPPLPQSSLSALQLAHESPCVTSFRRTATPSDPPPSSSSLLLSNGLPYTSSCVLPVPDDHVTQGCHTLLHLDCGSGIVVAYFGTQTEYWSAAGGTGVRSWLPQGETTVVVVYQTPRQTCFVTQ